MTGIVTDSFPERLARVRDRIASACARARRDPRSVHLLAVTKLFGPEAIREAYEAGLRDFGESYVQERERKAPAVADLTGAKFHLIGHLQTNKAKKAAQLFASIDSVDSVKLAARLDAEEKPLDVAIEVKLSEEESKSGADPADLPAITEAIRNSRNLHLRGLMTVPPWSENAELARPYFARLRQLAARHGISELSMGMSNDLEVAIEEGATLVRVGTGLFGEKEADLTVGSHAPPPGSRSGVADYAETLKGALQFFGSVTGNPRNPDIHLYHLGNNRLHARIYRQALKTPGVIVLHDAVLHHLMLGTLSHEQYMAEWIYNYGEWRRDLGEELWRERARCASDPRYFQFPLLRRVLERSRGVIVHNRGAAAIACAHGAANVIVIPHFCEMNAGAEALETARFRERIAVEQGATLFGIFGYLRETKRVVPCIEAFRRLHAVRPDAALLIAGECASPDLARLLEIEARHPAIRRLGHLNERDFAIAAGTVDCCLTLRYPGAGETSGIAIRLMGLAKPVVVTDSFENADIPGTAVLRVAAGVAESAELFDHMLLVTGFPPLARQIGRAAQLHIGEHHALESVARKYWETLCAAAS